MATVQLRCSLVVPPGQLAAGVNRAIAEHLARALRAGYEGAVKRLLGDELLVRMRASTEYQILANITADPAHARSQVGVVNGALAAEQVVNGLKDSLAVAIDMPRATSGGLTGGVTVGVSRDDFSDVLAQPLSRFMSNGHNVDWLHWMLLEGSSLVVAGFKFVAEPRHAKASRTGVGIMVKSSSGWQVPAPLGGTKADNWILHLLTGLDGVVSTILIEELRRRI